MYVIGGGSFIINSKGNKFMVGNIKEVIKCIFSNGNMNDGGENWNW